ncbi:sterile alpha motif domain-containing protein 10-like [Hyperolius riggenbachi]|uniref:sterile alpha motif domain-containing protein 10-like n=1 Tax=Hyperolius riggenbachi TaxID=752182 RepID=UPI0035A354D8
MFLMLKPGNYHKTAAHFRFCRNLLEHTVSTENLNHRFRREIGSSLTWHDGRGNRTSGGRAIKLLKQPGTDISQVRLMVRSVLWSEKYGNKVAQTFASHCRSPSCRPLPVLPEPPGAHGVY